MTIFDATQNEMGNRYGGWDYRADCSKSPPYPQHKPTAVDNVVDMCELSFDVGMRGDGGLNAQILEFSQITCDLPIRTPTPGHV